MSRRLTLTFLCAAALSLALPSSAAAGPAGSEYLPKVPSSGASSSAAPEPTVTSSAPETTVQAKKKQPKGHEASRPRLPVPSPVASEDGSSGGSILLSPTVLLMVAGVVLIAIGMTMRRRKTRSLKYRAKKRRDAGPPRNARPTPEGEIVGRGDRAR